MKQPFTNAGFHALQTELYQLPDSQLIIQAQVILLDFIVWMEDHFELDAKQSAFLIAIDPLMISFLAALTSTAVANRLEINLIKDEEAGARDDDKKRKIIRPVNSLVATADSLGVYNASGSLNIFIVYEEV